MIHLRICSLALCALLVASPSLAQTATNLSVNAQLLVAARHGDQKAVERALSQGAVPNSRNRLGKTPLLMASEKGNVALAETMLKAGADVIWLRSNGSRR